MLVPHLRHHLNIVQVRSAPPNLLEMSQDRGRSLYVALETCGWHLALEIPGNDYGQVSSLSRVVVERAIALVKASA